MLGVSLRKYGRRTEPRGQAMVEFALTSMLFIFLLLSIIELARILHAYITLQHAARAAARYAVTGQWYERYAISPLGDAEAGWQHNPGGDDNLPQHHIAPCWPRFPGDPAGADPLAGEGFYEPFRNARTCSIEETALRNMLGLALDPHAEDGVPNHYEVVVRGWVPDVNPTEGTFNRGIGASQQLNVPYTNYYWNYNAVPGTVRGFGGRPQEKVVVQINYDLKLITPGLSAVWSHVNLSATAVMVNEAFGSTSFQRTAAEPPELPAVPPLNPPIPPDLVVSKIEYSGPSTVRIGQPLTFDVTVMNKGELNANGAFRVALYACSSVLSPEEAPIPGSCTQLGANDALLDLWVGQSATVPVTATFGAATTGDQVLYAWVDSANTVDELGTGVLIDAKREAFNVMLYKCDSNGDGSAEETDCFDVGRVADFDFSMTVSDPAPAQNDVVNFTIAVTNTADPATAGPITGAKVCDVLPAGLTLVTPPPDFDLSTSCFENLTLAPGDTVGFTLSAEVTAAAGRMVNTAELILPDDVTDSSGSKPAYTASRAVTVQGVELSITKEVRWTGASAPEPGDIVPYHLTVSNASGYSDAASVTVEDDLPSGVTLVAGSLSPASCIEGDPIVCNLGSLAAGSSVSITYEVQVNAGVEGVQTNTATVSSTQTDGDDDNNEDTATFTVPPPARADLGLRFSSVRINGATYTPGMAVNTGDRVQLVLEITNGGNAGTSNITVQTNTAPANSVSGGNETAPSGTSYARSGQVGTGVWTITTLNSGEDRTLLLEMIVAPGMAGQSLTTSAEVTGHAMPEFGPLTNSASVSIPISTAVDIAVDETVSPTSAGVNTEVTYTVAVTNHGPDAATNVEIRDGNLSNAISKGMLAVVDAGSFNGTGWVIGTINPGQTVTLNLRVRVVSNPDLISQLDTQASVFAVAQPDGNPANDTDGAALAINWPQPIFVNLGPTGSTTTTWQESDSRISYTGTWTTYTGAEASGGTMRYTNVLGATASFTFSGDGFTLVRHTADDRGAMEVTIDGVKRSYSNYSAAPVWQVPLTFNLSSGTHTVTIRNAEAKWLDVDAIIISQNLAANCGSIMWGAAPGSNTAWGIGSDRLWQRVQPYSAGSWGYLTTNAYNGSANDWTVNYPDGSTVNKTGDPNTHWLMNCRASVTRLDMRFDNMAPGRYTLYLAFMDNSATAAGQRLIDADYTSGTSTTSLMNNFDIYAAAGPRVYTIQRFDVTVTSAGWITVTVRKDAASSQQAIISGMGLVFQGP